MAIAIGSRVALKVTGNSGSPLAIGQVTAQPPVFGVSETAGGGPYTIDWENGNQKTTVPLAVLDELLPAGPTTIALLGQVVRPTGYLSSSYNSRVVDAYNRSGPAADCVLLQTLDGSMYIEMLAANVTVVAGE